jgi:cystathionine gamma-lyase
MLNLIPLALVATVAKKHGIPLIVDNTFASPYLQLPLSLGATGAWPFFLSFSSSFLY